MNGERVTISTIKKELGGFLKFMLGQLKPRGRILTPFNIISGIIVLTAAVLLFIRFTKGLGSITNLNQEYPWGIWIGFDVVTGVAFAGGGLRGHFPGLYPEDGEIPSHSSGDRAERVSGLCVLRRGSAARPGPPLERDQPGDRQLFRG
ncbi:hypothetical protein ACFL5K_04225 [Gemmatimonadota bacterium]